MSGRAECETAIPEGNNTTRYIYRLDPPVTWKEVTVSRVVIVVRRGSSEVMTEQGIRLISYNRMHSIISPDEILHEWCGYEEQLEGRMRLLLSVTGSVDSPPFTTLPYHLRDLWPNLGKETRIVVTYVCKKYNEDVERLRREVGDQEEPDEDDDEEDIQTRILASLRRIEDKLC